MLLLLIFSIRNISPEKCEHLFVGVFTVSYFKGYTILNKNAYMKSRCLKMRETNDVEILLKFGENIWVARTADLSPDLQIVADW